MKNTKKIILVFEFIILIFAFSSCRQHIDINDYIDQNLPLELKIGNQLKHPDIIQVNSNKYRKLIEWGKLNTDDWQSIPVSFIADIYVGQGKFRLLCLPNKEGVVIGFTDKLGNSRQYSKIIKKGELDFLRR
jgi:hypothetical protein